MPLAASESVPADKVTPVVLHSPADPSLAGELLHAASLLLPVMFRLLVLILLPWMGHWIKIRLQLFLLVLLVNCQRLSLTVLL